MYSLYLHILFCTHRCAYCDFNTYAGQEDPIPAYVDALCKEIEYVGKRFPSPREASPFGGRGEGEVHTVFFGGGTPSLLSPLQFDSIFKSIRSAFTLSFGGDKVASFFSLRMLDYGDLNKVNATEHEITLVAYDINGFVVAENTLAFTSDASFNPTSGSAGNLQESGDASANIGEPGNFVFSVYGTGIVRLELVYSSNKSGSISDPNHGFADLCFELEEQDIPEDATCVDFNTVIPGQVVEGLGVVHPYLNISSTGNAVAMAENQFPAAYGSPSGLNYGMGSLSGFSDIDKIHDYTFTFASGVSVDYFTVRMLDFGDLNKVLATEHNVKLEAFDSNGFLVSTSEPSFVTDAVFIFDTNFNQVDDSPRSRQQYAEGYVSARELRWLEAAITTDRPTLVFSHHSPITAYNVDNVLAKNILNAEAVRAILERYENVVAVISGHTPRPQHVVVNGIQYIIGDTLVNEEGLGAFAAISLEYFPSLRRATVLFEHFGLRQETYLAEVYIGRKG